MPVSPSGQAGSFDQDDYRHVNVDLHRGCGQFRISMSLLWAKRCVSDSTMSLSSKKVKSKAIEVEESLNTSLGYSSV